MKKRALVLSLLSSFLLLTSCNLSGNKNGDDESGSVDVTSDHKEELNGKELNIYSLNDFHGAVENDTSDGRMGLANMGTFFKRKGEEENTITLDQGDSWQGSIYSNYNYGALVDEVMSYAKFDARTVGNHDFDWGVDHLKYNTAASYYGYRIPTLCANVYDYNFDTKQFGNTQQSDIGQKSTTITLENGVKVGVVGVIGSSQITSISSIYTHDIGFKDHVSIAKQEAAKLREEGCDFVICSIHGGQEDLLGKGMKDYVDLVLCSHTHQYQDTVEGASMSDLHHGTIENGQLLYLQSNAYGRAYGEIHVTFNEHGYELEYTNRTYKNNMNNFTSVDPTVQSIINRYNAQCDEAASQVVVQHSQGTFYSSGNGVNLMCKAIMDQAEIEGYDDVVFSYCNYTRSNVSSSSWTFADLYQAFPFDNTIYIIEATGKEIYNKVRTSNWICKADDFDNQIDYSKKYKIAVVDYLAFHTNESRYYDIFPDNNGAYVGHLQDNYRDILKYWFARNGYTSGEHTLYASDFYDSVERHNKETMEYTIPEYTITFNLKGGTIEDESQLVRTANITQLYSEVYPNPAPTKENYYFGGWFIDSSCTITADGKYVISSRTLYARWDTDLPDSFVITQSMFDFAESSSKTINIYGIDFNFAWYKTVNQTGYNEIQINSSGWFEVSAPQTYKISHMHIEIYGSNENLTFSAAGQDVTNEGFVAGQYRSSYDFVPSAYVVDIKNRSSFTVYIYQIEFQIELA